MTLNVVKQKITECNSLKIQRLKQVGMRGLHFTRLDPLKGSRIGPPHFPVL